jgi:hypothetical protein
MSEYTIYKLVCNDEKLCSEIYVGSTKAYRARKNLHKNVCNNPNGKHYNLKVYTTIRDNGGWPAWRMVPIEVIPNTTKREAEIRENELMEIYNSKLNTNKASRGNITRKEYEKQYSIVKNLKMIKCKCGCFITSINLARHQTTTKCIKLMEKQNDLANMKEPPVI